MSNHAIELQQCSLRFNAHFSLKAIDWRLMPDQHWVILGANGAGKSALGAALAGAGETIAGQRTGLPARVGLVSLERQAELIERERARDDSDITDEVFEGTSVAELLAEDCQDEALCAALVERFDLQPLLARAFRQLSTGESRKLMLIQALTSAPDLLVLDEPFEGLDAESTRRWVEVLEAHAGHLPMVLVLNRLDEIPRFTTHIALMQAGELCQQAVMSDQPAVDQILQLLHLTTSELRIPAADPGAVAGGLDSTQPLVTIRDARIRYGDQVVFEHLDWQIDPGQHWQLSGPNGSGKTCLLNLITGDHPQCYSNDLVVFGYTRGQGESIWDIKQHIGYVSSALQWDYRPSASARNVIVSGFYDSIGLYQTATDSQRAIADAWLALLGMAHRGDAPFQAMSYGDQRLLLIARAMVKHPPLLILDEPCQGLDDRNRQLILALIEKICAEANSTVIYVTHHAADRINGIEHHLSLGQVAKSVLTD